MKGDGADSGLHLPGVPKLELDQLTDQLADRAHGANRAHGRLRALLRAIDNITGELSLQTVLRNTVEAARELVSARYAVVGTISSDGGRDQFVPVGVDTAVAAGIAHPSEGNGLLGALITDPRPIRLARLADDPRFAEFALVHPHMESFLGVSIQVRGAVFGYLYLTDDETGAFTAEDEQVVLALAQAAGAAICVAMCYDESQGQQRWLTASAEISVKLLTGHDEKPLQLIAQRAMELADADAASLALTTDEHELVIKVAIGANTDSLVEQHFTWDETLSGMAVQKGEPQRIADSAEWPSRFTSAIDAGPVMALPLQGTSGVRGVLTVARRTGRAPFTDIDLAMAAGFASQASVALELAESRPSWERLALLEDRERIARDLHDHVIQDLFAIGLSLEAVVASLGPEQAAAQRLKERVEDIDRTIRRIRSTIFALRGSIDFFADGLRQQVLDVAEDLTPALGFAPAVSFSGLVDLGTSSDLTDDVVAAAREALANVAKHARATSASVAVEMTAGNISVTVIDDGIGVRRTSRSSGIANLRARAEARGGTFTLAPGASGGTVAMWTATT